MRKTFADAYQKRAFGIYKRPHIDRLISMVAKAAGLKPHGWYMPLVCSVIWRVLSLKRWQLARTSV